MPKKFFRPPGFSVFIFIVGFQIWTFASSLINAATAWSCAGSVKKTTSPMMQCAPVNHQRSEAVQLLFRYSGWSADLCPVFSRKINPWLRKTTRATKRKIDVEFFLILKCFSDFYLQSPGIFLILTLFSPGFDSVFFFRIFFSMNFYFSFQRLNLIFYSLNFDIPPLILFRFWLFNFTFFFPLWILTFFPPEYLL